jgi:hypothetical protein
MSSSVLRLWAEHVDQLEGYLTGTRVLMPSKGFPSSWTVLLILHSVLTRWIPAQQLRQQNETFITLLKSSPCSFFVSDRMKTCYFACFSRWISEMTCFHAKRNIKTYGISTKFFAEDCHWRFACFRGFWRPWNMLFLMFVWVKSC